MKFFIYLSSVLSFSILHSQTDVFTGSIPTNAEISFFEHITSSDEHYYFGSRNIEGDVKTISIFQTTFDFELVNSIENLKIRENESSILTYMQVVDDQLVMISSANLNSQRYLYSYQFDLDLSNLSIIDSLEISNGNSFFAREFKNLNEKTIYTFGNFYSNEIASNFPVNYLEVDLSGKFKRFENLTIESENIFGFDYNTATNQYIIIEPFGLKLLDSTFKVEDNYNANLPINVGTAANFFAALSNCNFIETSTLQCIGSAALSEPREYSNFVSLFDIDDSSIRFANATPLHPNNIMNEVTTLIHSVRDEYGNYYFAYHERFVPNDNNTEANKVFISKIDKDFNELFFIELDGVDEHVISESALDKENNLIIVGAKTTPEDPVGHNFFIKISENGEVLTNTFSPFENPGINIYPNPCLDYITIDNEDISGEACYSIYTLDGRLLENKSLGAAKEVKINTSEFNSGMYILHILNRNSIRSEKFIKN